MTIGNARALRLNVPMPWDVRMRPVALPARPMVSRDDLINLIRPINAPQPDAIDTLNYQNRSWPSTWEPEIAGLGLEPAGSTDLVGMMKDLHAGYVDLAPTIDFFGNHPLMTLMLIMGAIVVGGAAGGYIGAGYKTGKR